MSEADPLAHVRVGDPDPTFTEPLPGEPGDPPGDDPCDAEIDGGPCCTRQRHSSGWQHIAGAGPQKVVGDRRLGGVIATWTDAEVPR